jgi:hypothetical protein
MMLPMPRCFQIHPNDNVATMLDDVAGANAPVHILGASGGSSIWAREPIAMGHKIALRDICAGDAIVKFGVTIGKTTAAISAGQWVHLHNCASNFDQRSQTLDLHSGSATDTKYE